VLFETAIGFVSNEAKSFAFDSIGAINLKLFVAELCI
jgi:hypothetical protein